MTRKIIAGNWKQNGNLRSSVTLTKNIISALARSKCKHEVIIFPPSIYLLSIKALVSKKIKLGSQDVSAFDDGAFTGEISAAMLKDSKVNYCLVGHSERRHIINETEELLSTKVTRLFENNISIIYCIGETLEEYKAKKTKTILRRQINNLIRKNKNNLKNGSKKMILAYEPVWAIGTGLVPSASELNDIFTFIRDTLNKADKRYSSIKILYGGSVTPNNASLLMETNHMDGLLVGGASLISKKFIDICSTI